ncbi:MAG: phage tail protein [Anaerolineae bacterium]|nr:phage tail protein [Anaerolineae bacterium]MEB2287479.1 phage tail protein [Anaerolineae bacterium]
MAETSTSIQAVDSLSANEFHVEINGMAVSGVFGVSGLYSRRVDLEAGKLVNPPVLITKMVQRDPDLPFNAWLRETLANPTARIVRQIAVVAMDEGVETRRWVLRDAWISAVGYSDFDSGSDQLIEERITVQHGGIEVVW